MNSNMIKTVVIEFANRFCTLAMVLLVSKNFPISTYGYFTLFVTISSIGQTAIDFGSQNYGVKTLIGAQEKNINSIISKVSVFRFLGLLLWIVFAIGYASFFNNSFIWGMLLVIWGIVYFFYTDWILKGVGLIANQALVSFATNALGTIILISLINARIPLRDELLVTITKIAPLFLAVIICIVLIGNRFMSLFSSLKISFENYEGREFKESIYFTIGSFCARAYNSIGLIIAGLLLDKTILGAISYAFTFYNIYSMGRAIIVSSLYPYLYKMGFYKAKKLVLYFNAIAFVFFLLFLSIYIFNSDFIIHLIIPASAEISPVILFNFSMSVALIGVSCASFTTMTFIQAFGGGQLFNQLMFLGFFIVLTANMLCYVLNLLEYGSMIAVLVAESCILIYSYFYVFNKMSRYETAS